MMNVSEILHKILGFMMPDRAAVNAHLVDDLYYFVFILSIVGLVGLMGVMVFFIVRYHRSQNDKSAYIPHNALAETIWTVVPTIIFVGIAVWGLIAFYEAEKKDPNALEIKVTGKQWMWEFGYKKGNLEANITDVMYVPINTPVHLDMTSTDVLHSFFVPSFRIKRDTVPGMRTKLNFTATKLGDFQIFCAEFCGTAHSKMRGIVRVVSKKRFQRWLNREIKEANISDPVELGSRLFARKGCTSCHSVESNTIIGPGLKGLWGAKREFADGSSITAADAEYIRESILMPNAKVVKGYPAKMNSFAGQLTEKEIDYLIEYIKTLK
ncbi:MAG: cytochrome c oxidase subunit II [Bacteriovoracaceae bacterium]|nr:cytochrome c oxidase subunit II [Bacteriovoracaceae bacterium]